MEAKLRAKLWVQAQIRSCLVEGVPATVVRKGDADAGAVLVKVNRGAAGCDVYTQARSGDGVLGWMRATGDAPVAETDADAYIRRQIDRDYDLWVVEIEDPRGRPPVGGPLIR